MILDLFPVLKDMRRRGDGGDLSGRPAAAARDRSCCWWWPRLLLLDELTEGIQPSIIKDIGRAISASAVTACGRSAIILVEQYLDFAQELGDQFLVMDRGQVIYASDRASLDEAALKRAMAI